MLRRLDVELLQISPSDVGWDVFSLTYIVDAPITMVLHQKAMLQYKQIFNFLWRIKKVEMDWARVWLSAVHVASTPEMRPMFHLCQSLCAEMGHFIRQIQYYILFEVIEFSWASFLKGLEVAVDLDHVLQAHETYLATLMLRSFLSPSVSNKVILPLLQSLFDTIAKFFEVQVYFLFYFILFFSFKKRSCFIFKFIAR